MAATLHCCTFRSHCHDYRYDLEETIRCTGGNGQVFGAFWAVLGRLRYHSPCLPDHRIGIRLEGNFAVPHGSVDRIMTRNCSGIDRCSRQLCVERVSGLWRCFEGAVYGLIMVHGPECMLEKGCSLHPRHVVQWDRIFGVVLTRKRGAKHSSRYSREGRGSYLPKIPRVIT
jgi:hypothetical protein